MAKIVTEISSANLTAVEAVRFLAGAFAPFGSLNGTLGEREALAVIMLGAFIASDCRTLEAELVSAQDCVDFTTVESTQQGEVVLTTPSSATQIAVGLASGGGYRARVTFPGASVWRAEVIASALEAAEVSFETSELSVARAVDWLANYQKGEAERAALGRALITALEGAGVIDPMRPVTV